MAIQLRAIGFDPGEELAGYQDQVLGQQGKYGACVSFVGTMRDFNQDHTVCAMTLEHYPGMTEKHLQQICVDARRQWNILDVLIVHRIGEVHPNDPLVLVAVWSAHRAAAFDACRYLIEELKTRVPFWKKEQRGAVTHWVEHNTPAA